MVSRVRFLFSRWCRNYSAINSGLAYLPLIWCLFLMAQVRGADWSKDILPTEEGSLVRTQLGLPTNGHIIAVGHFTLHRRLDCVVLDESRKIATIYIQGADDKRYHETTHGGVSAPPGHEIVAAFLSDYDHDGFTDLLLSHREANKLTLHHTLYLGDGNKLEKAKDWNIAPSRGQLATIDWDGSLQLSLMGVPHEGAQETHPAIWKNSATTPNQRSSGFIVPPQVIIEFGNLPLGPFILQGDFNGDGRADLIFTTSDKGDTQINYLELWTRKNELGIDSIPYQLALRRKLPPGAGPLAIADIDGDGLLDIVFAVCYPANDCSQENSIHILFNLQRGFCTGNKDLDEGRRFYSPILRPDATECRHHQEEVLFQAEGEVFDFQLNDNNDSPNHIIITMEKLFLQSKNNHPEGGESESPQKDDITDLNPNDLRIMFTNHLTLQPIAIGVGDYDLDSYSDLVVVMGQRQSGHPLDQNRAMVLRSVPCDNTRCTTDQVKARRHTLEAVTRQVSALTEIRQVVGVAFADFQGMGPPGFIVNFIENGALRLATIRNGISRDAFSLRAETLNGVCPAPCKEQPTAGSLAERPIAVNYVGASYLFSYVDEHGLIQVRAGTQLGQTMNGALQSPTALFGLGRTSNFIQNIEVGITCSHYMSHIYGKINIFPNSEILFIPPHADSDGAWRAELQIHPAEYLWYVIISISSALVVLALITGWFKWQEMREDEAERKKTTHLINFDAF